MAATRTVRDLITRALRVAGVVGAGETPGADDADDALLSLNMMLDAWQAERLFAYSIVDRTYALTAGLATYSIGSGATINVPRPVRIEWAFTRDSSNIDRQIRVVLDDVFAAISVKNIGNTYPTALYYQPSYPNGTINLWPLPAAGLTLHIGAWEVLTEYASLNATLSLPPGYEDAFVYSLVERLCPEYGKAISADISKLAAKARANIEQDNLPGPLSVCEFGGVGRTTMLPAWAFTSGNF